MNYQLLIQLRNMLVMRRQRHSELTFLINALWGPAMIIMGFSIYDLGQYCLEHNLPLYLIMLCLTVVWIMAGIPVQWRLYQDQRWQKFVRHIPVGPIPLIIIHIRTGVLINFTIVIMIFCGLWGAQINWWIIPDIIRWFVLLTACIWVISLQITAALIFARRPRLFRLALALVLLDGFVLAGRIFLSFSTNPQGNLDIKHFLATDPLLLVSGISATAHTLTAPSEFLWPSSLTCLLHLTGVTAIMFMFCTYFISKTSGENQRCPLFVKLTRGLRKPIGRLLPGAHGAQIAVEWLRTLRSHNEKITLYTFIAVIIALFCNIRQSQVNYLPILFLLALAVVTEGAPELLSLRRGNKLYNRYGVNSKHYLIGFFTSIGCFVSLLTIMLIPVFGVQNFNWATTLLVFCVCAAMGFALVGISVWIDDYCKKTKFPNRFFAAILIMFRQVFNSLPPLLFALIFFVLGTYNIILPLILAAIMLIGEVKRTQRHTVEELYWKLSYD